MSQNGIKPVYDCNDQYWIKSQYTSRKYKATLNSCTCPDNKKGYVCKHIILLKDHVRPKDTIIQKCVKCSSEKIVKNGTRKIIDGRKQMWKCHDCKYRFALEDIREYKATTEIIIKSIDLYVQGESYRSIANTLKQFHNLKVSQVSVMNWIKKYTFIVDNYLQTFTPEASDTWHADEQFVSVKNRQRYVWNCMDNKTRFLLASNVTNQRSTKDARTLFQQAKKTANKMALTVITDGSFNYVKA